MYSFATDVLVEILRRLPANSRRRSRLVCRRWLNLIDKRTKTDLQSRGKTLLVTWDGTALILGDNVQQRPRILASAKGQNSLSIIGTCNGLVCLCDASKFPGAITLANPVTGERLVLPPLPCADIITGFNLAWPMPYSFAHDQMAGRYTVVHLPCCIDRVYEFDMLQVFTLGEGAWRDVPTPKYGGAGVSCRFDIRVVSIDGAIYWLAEDTENIMSFDIREECVTSVEPLPMEATQVEAIGGTSCRLADVHGRLGMAIFYDSCWMQAKTDVWVLESVKGEQTWTLRYLLCVNHQLILPHFTHGEHLLCVVNDRDLFLYLLRTSPDGVIGVDDRAIEIAKECYVRRAFAHVETKEPLSIYKLW